MKLLSLIFIIAFAIIAQSSEFNVDASHSHVGFKVRYMMLTSVQGQFNEFKGRVIFAENGDVDMITGNIVVSSIDTNNKKRDAHLKSDDFFNAKVYPEIKFVSDKIHRNDIGFTAIGQLEIHGITNNVSIPFTLTNSLVDIYGNERIGLTGGLRINRKEEGSMYSRKIDNGGLVVDDYIDIELNIQLIEDT